MKKKLIKQIKAQGYKVVSGWSFDKNGDNCIVWQAEKGEEFFEHKTLKGLLKLIQNK